MLGPLIKQLLSGLGAIPVEMVHKFRGQKAIGDRRLQLPDIVKMFAAITSLQRAFICIDALDENVFQGINGRFLMHWGKFSRGRQILECS